MLCRLDRVAIGVYPAWSRVETAKPWQSTDGAYINLIWRLFG